MILLLNAVLCLLPTAFVLALIIRKRKEQREICLAPINELSRRPAGESLRIRLEHLEEKLTDDTLGLLLFPLMLILFLAIRHPIDELSLILLFTLSVGSSAFFGIRIYKLARSRANYKLGFEGERFVGEVLCRLITHGFEIYHDVPFDGFNIDHVLVGPRGVFIVETKTRRKPVDKSGGKKYHVTYDGKFLQWPWGADRFGIDQAKNNAKTLSAWLSSATGEIVSASPILTLPGWMVERKAPTNGIYILNPKEINGVCSSQPPKLQESQIKRICHQLDQKCRIEIIH